MHEDIAMSEEERIVKHARTQIMEAYFALLAVDDSPEIASVLALVSEADKAMCDYLNERADERAKATSGR